MCFPKSLFLMAVFAVFVSCNKHEWYKNEQAFSNSEELAMGFRHGMAFHYQGSVPAQILNVEALHLDSTEGNFWREYGVAHLKRGLASEMHYYYAQAVKYNPLDWQGYRGYCYLYFYRDYKRAIADFDALDTLTPDFTDYPQGQSVDYMRGIAYYGLKQYDKALDYFDTYINEVTRLNGEDWVDVYAIIYRGLTYEKIGDLDKAINDFDFAHRLAPELSDCFYHNARIHKMQGNLPEAIANISKAKEQFIKGYFHQRPYVEVLDQIYIQDIEVLQNEILAN